MNSNKTTQKKPCKECPYTLGIVTFFDDPCPECIEENYGFGERMIAEEKKAGKAKKYGKRE